MSPSRSLAVLIHTGAGPGEAELTAVLLDSLLAHEPAVAEVVVIDGGPAARRLPAELPASLSGRLTVLAAPPAGGRVSSLGQGCSATLLGLRHLALRDPQAALVVRLAPRALVLAPFSTRLADAFAAAPSAGVLGNRERTFDGVPRPAAAWEPVLRRLGRPLSLWPRPPHGSGYVRVALSGRGARVRGELEAALAAGYSWGEHCLPGAYALRRELLARLAARGALDDPLRWQDARVSEEVMVGILARACRLAPEDDGGVLAVGARELDPAAALAAGRAIAQPAQAQSGLLVTGSSSRAGGSTFTRARTRYRGRPFTSS